MAETTAVTPAVLAWARKTIGYTEEQVAEKLKEKRVTPDLVRLWESGGSQPIYSQLKKLAQLYKRPVAIFFFASPPQENPIEKDFRALPSVVAKATPPHIRCLVRLAKARQIDLEELQAGGSGKAEVLSLKAGKTESAKRLAARIRDRIDISTAEQSQWENIDTAFKKWRTALENLGVWVFKEAFKDDDYCGFCVYDERFPLIYINNSQSPQRQIFTLFHELGHLLIGKAGVDIRARSAPALRGIYQKEEVFCNAFAASCLVPDIDLERYTTLPDDTMIKNIANQYKVSFEVVLRKFLDKDFISSENYQNKIDAMQKPKQEGKDPGGGNYYLTQQAYLGRKYMRLVFEQYHQRRIDRRQLADYLGVKSKNVTNLENLFLNRPL